MTTEEKAKAYDEALKRAKAAIDMAADKDLVGGVARTIFSELRESEDERIKNKSGYYKAGKFWKASTLWNAVKGKSPQRVPNRYILQECTWNISSLQCFADEVKNVQEVDLNYPIILDMNGNILDGAHRVVKAYLEGKDIDIVYLGDDEWPEPDYDEEKAVKESEDERIRKCIGMALTDVDEQRFKDFGTTLKDCLAYLEKQKENPKSADSIPEYCASNARCPYKIYGDEDFIGDIKDTPAYHFGFDEGVRSEREKQKEQKPIQTPEEKEYIRTLKNLISAFVYDKQPQDVVYYQHVYDWLEERHIEQKPAEWSEEDEERLINTSISFLKDFADKGYENAVECIDWLKSLRPSWKPSEEQMKAFKGYIEDFQAKAEAAVGGWNNFDVMIRLYEQLKKLM